MRAIPRSLAERSETETSTEALLGGHTAALLGQVLHTLGLIKKARGGTNGESSALGAPRKRGESKAALARSLLERGPRKHLRYEKISAMERELGITQRELARALEDVGRLRFASTQQRRSRLAQLLLRSKTSVARWPGLVAEAGIEPREWEIGRSAVVTALVEAAIEVTLRDVATQLKTPLEAAALVLSSPEQQPPSRAARRHARALLERFEKTIPALAEPMLHLSAAKYSLMSMMNSSKDFPEHGPMERSMHRALAQRLEPLFRDAKRGAKSITSPDALVGLVKQLRDATGQFKPAKQPNKALDDGLRRLEHAIERLEGARCDLDRREMLRQVHAALVPHTKAVKRTGTTTGRTTGWLSSGPQLARAVGATFSRLRDRVNMAHPFGARSVQAGVLGHQLQATSERLPPALSAGHLEDRADRPILPRPQRRHSHTARRGLGERAPCTSMLAVIGHLRS